MDRLAELAASIGRDPAEVARQARETASDARNSADWSLLSQAQSVLGRALRNLGEIQLTAALASASIPHQQSPPRPGTKSPA